MSEMRPSEQNVDFAFVIRWLWGNKVSLVFGGVLGLAVAIGLALTAREIFRAEVVLAEANDASLAGGLMSRLGGIAGIAGINLDGDDAGRHDRALLRSRRLAEEFVVRQKLLPVLTPDHDPEKAETLWYAVRRFKGSMLSIREDSRTQLITVSMSAADPDKAAEWANAYVALTNEMARTRDIAQATRNITFLRSEIAKTEVAELQKVLYQLVESESKTLMLASARPEYAFSVVDPAVPPALRDSPKRAVMAIFGLVIGGLAGIVFVLARSLLARVRSAGR
jgi:LPS O-antigen subunit length determinant protein (WzzB/FepE family)